MKNKPYWKTLSKEYSIPLSENASDKELQEWYKKDREQSNHLIEKYGESSWRINELANSLRNEDISESFFRQLVRYEMDKCFKRLNDEN